MIVCDFHVVSVAPLPDEADAELIVDADAVLSLAVSLERFEAISWDCRKIAETGGYVQFPELSLRRPLERVEFRHTLSVRKSLGILVAKALDHMRNV